MANKTGGSDRKLASRDAYLDRALDSLESIDSGSQKDTERYQALMQSIAALQAKTDRFYDQPIRTAAELGEIRDAYEQVRKACDSFLEENSGFHLHLYKRQRQRGVQAIRDIVDRDMGAMEPKNISTPRKKTLRELLTNARRSMVTVEDPATVKGVGGSVSSRIPIAIEGEEGEERGFFTEHSHVETTKEISDRIYDHIQGTSALKGIFPKPDKTGKVPQPTQAEKDQLVRSVNSHIAGKVNNGEFNIDRDAVCSSPELFYRTYSDVLTELYGKPDPGSSDGKKYLDEKDAMRIIKSRATREAIHDLSKEIYRSVRQQTVNKDTALIDEGQETATRSVAMSRVAEMFGMKDLVAHAETMELQMGGRRTNGVFMRTAEGADLSLTKTGDPLAQVFDYKTDGRGNLDSSAVYRGMDTAHVKSQLADLQVLDFLCGNGDRHSRNYIYQMGKDELGNPIVTGITGIDNDLSFGRLKGATTEQGTRIGSLVPPDDIRIMTKATYDTIVGMDPNTLMTQLADLGLSDEEQKAAVVRLNALKDRLAPENVSMCRPDMPADLQYRSQRKASDKVFIVPDETAFTNIPFEMLAQDSPHSYFGQMGQAPEQIHAMDLFDKAKKKTETAVKDVHRKYHDLPVGSKEAEERIAEDYQKELAGTSAGPSIRYAKAKRVSAFAAIAEKWRVRKSLKELRALSDKDAVKGGIDKAAAHKRQRKQTKQASGSPKTL
ncbi:MAG: hypothetical protein K6G16_10275 [Lachnospiraceae bacterium]|nr:hypothetical protein [Lachnospiraceae bacterium]